MRYFLLSLIAVLSISGCGGSGDNADAANKTASTLFGTWESNEPLKNGAMFTKQINTDGTMTVTMKSPDSEEQKYTLKYKKIENESIEVPTQKVLLFGKDYPIPAHLMKLLDENKLELRNGTQITQYHRISDTLASNNIAAKEQSAKTDALKTAPAPIDPSAKVPFVATWHKKNLDPGYERQILRLPLTGSFSTSWRDQLNKMGTSMAGPWKNLTEKKIELSNKLDNTPRVIFTAELLDPETLEVDLNGKKELYVRTPPPTKNELPRIAVEAQKNNPPSKVLSEIDAQHKAQNRRLKFTFPVWVRKDSQTQTEYMLDMHPDSSAIFETNTFKRPSGPEITKTTWEILSDTKIKMSYRPAPGAPKEEYATGELIDENTLVITIAGKQYNYTSDIKMEKLTD